MLWLDWRLTLVTLSVTPLMLLTVFRYSYRMKQAARKARELGVKVHPASPVLGVETRNGVHHLRTPGGTVRARAVGFATGGYTSNALHGSLRSKIMPILSNSLVTRPLTEQELEATGFKTTQVITDTRTLRFYYRRLPDNRVQIGSRSAINE